MKHTTKIISIRLSDDILQIIDDFKKQHRCTRTFAINWFLLGGIKHTTNIKNNFNITTKGKK